MKAITIEDLLEKLYAYNDEEIRFIKKAYLYANHLHAGQTRQSGEAYISHPLAVAYILAEMHLDANTICAGILHDTVEDTDITLEEIAQVFNQDVANLVDGVTKISRMNFSSKQAQNLANTRKIIRSMIQDIRIMYIKLADRLHNMRTLEFKRREKQIENSLETMEIFVPSAYRIGACRTKTELEDLSFMYLKPDDYQKYSEIKMKVEESSNSCMLEMSDEINEMLKLRNIHNDIKIRTKNVYGIYDSFERGCEKLEDIHDLLSLKIMVNNIDNCYLTLGLIHSKYHPMNDKFKDYICNPKTNMYQSLHTTVFGEDNRLVQSQIRTYDMDKIASFGLTAYWDINKGQTREIMQQELKNKYQFYKSLVEIDSAYADNLEFVNQVKMELFTDNVYVYTPKGEIIELPKGSTPIDLAYRIHTDVGNTMVGALVNDNNVSGDYILKNKDRVRIITDSLSSCPSEEWIDNAYTTYAKRKIKGYR